MKNHLAKAFGVAAAAPLLLIGLAASAQTTTTTDSTGTMYDTTTGTTVSAPNTGAGADAPFNVALIGASVLVLGAGALYLSRERAA